MITTGGSPSSLSHSPHDRRTRRAGCDAPTRCATAWLSARRPPRGATARAGCDGASGVRRRERGAAPPLPYRVPRAQDRVAAPAGGRYRPGRRRAVPARALRLRRARHRGARARAARLRRRRVAVPARRDHQPWRVHRAGAGGQPGGEQPPRRRPRAPVPSRGAGCSSAPGTPASSRSSCWPRRHCSCPACSAATGACSRRRSSRPSGRRRSTCCAACSPASDASAGTRPASGGGHGAARPVRGAGARRRDRPVGVRLGVRARYGHRRAGVSAGPHLVAQSAVGRAEPGTGRKRDHPRPGDEPRIVPIRRPQRHARAHVSAPAPDGAPGPPAARRSTLTRRPSSRRTAPRCPPAAPRYPTRRSRETCGGAGDGPRHRPARRRVRADLRRRQHRPAGADRPAPRRSGGRGELRVAVRAGPHPGVPVRAAAGRSCCRR